MKRSVKILDFRDLQVNSIPIRRVRLGASRNAPQVFYFHADPLGRAYRLSLVADQPCDLKLNEGRFCLKRTLIDQNGSNAAKKAFEGFYSEKGRKWIGDRVTYFAPKVGVKPTRIAIKDLGYRWASCTSNNGLALHWKTMMAPPKIIDYVVVHELCHIYHRNHSDAFWNEIDKVMPDYRERKTWLKQHGAGLDL